MGKYFVAFVAACLAVSTAPAIAGTKVQGSLVAPDAGADPKLSNKSKFKIDGKGAYKVGLKGITDSMGNLAAISTGNTPDTQYWVTIKGGAPGLTFEYNAPFNITKAGQAKIQGSLSSLVALLPAGTSIGIFGVEVHEPTIAGQDTTDCTEVMTVPLIPDPEILQVYIEGISSYPTNPCASGALVGFTGISTELP